MIRGERMSRPALIVDSDGCAVQLKRIPFMSGSFNETWLQEILANNPFLIPASDIDTEYGSLVCIGREVPVGSGETQGYIDNLYVTPTGHIVIVETKLFRNQESRRTVVAQIIDYAKELQKWDCEKLDEVAGAYSMQKTGQAFRIIDLMENLGHLTYSDEATFTDRINRSLAKAQFLLMIVGDGIRSSVQQLSDFLNENTSMAFHLALAEMEIYQLNDGVVIIPNLLTKTSIIERSIISLNEPRDNERAKSDQISTQYVRKPILTRREFIDIFSSNGGYDPDEIGEFVGDIETIDGFSVGISPTELTIRFSPEKGRTYALITFGISSGDSSMWIMPGRIKAALEKHGIFPFEADPFLDFFKGYVDLKRSKTSPYENLAGFYYADIPTVLEHKRDFISAAEQFAISIQTNE